MIKLHVTFRDFRVLLINQEKSFFLLKIFLLEVTNEIVIALKCVFPIALNTLKFLTFFHHVFGT